jgi:protease I
MARVALLLADGFEDMEFRVLVDRLRSTRNDVVVVGAKCGTTLRGRSGEEQAQVHAEYFRVLPEQFHGVAILGGESASCLCADKRASHFLRLFFLSGRPIVAIGAGPQLLIPAGIASGCRVTSAPALKQVMEEAGANWVDDPVVMFGHGHIVTGQGAADVPRLAQVFDQCLRGSQTVTCPRESLSEMPPLDC